MRVTLGIVLTTLVAGLSSCGGGSNNPPTYTVSGTVDHLSSSGLTLTNGTTTLSIASGATSFAFPDQLPNGTAYQITVASQPAGGNCVVSQGGGIVAAANVGNVDVQCNTVISSPTAIGIYPVATASDGYSHAYVPVTMVGNSKVSIDAVLDTGSSGVVLNALDLFPSSVVTADGFVGLNPPIFPAPLQTITYNGITVTNIVLETTLNDEGAGFNVGWFGAVTNPPAIFAIGNLGFAQVSFGSAGQITTSVIPILLVYQVSVQGVVASPDTVTSNIFGVNPSLTAMYQHGSHIVSVAVCNNAPIASSACGLLSPLRSLTYASTVDPGYVLQPFTLQNCTPGTSGSCSAVPSLQVGVTPAVTAGFTAVALSCSQLPPGASAPSVKICSQVVSPSTVAFAGGSTSTASVIVNTGNSGMMMGTVNLTGFPATISAGTPISVTMGPAFNYSFTAGTGNFATTLTPQLLAGGELTDIGIGFFATHAMFVDYQAGTEGWK
ncbi:MAG TPA: hypothetical protein VF534_22200 [Paraburkholderia sp.]